MYFSKTVNGRKPLVFYMPVIKQGIMNLNSPSAIQTKLGAHKSKFSFFFLSYDGLWDWAHTGIVGF